MAAPGQPTSDDGFISRRVALSSAALAAGAVAAGVVIKHQVDPSGGNADAGSALTAGSFTVGLAGSGATYTAVNPNADLAVNQALQAAGVGGAVRVLAGSYTIGLPIQVGDRQALIGDGSSQTVFTASSSFPAGAVMVRTPVGFTGTRVVLREFACIGAGKALNGVLVEANGKPTIWSPDPMPRLDGLFVANTVGDGIVLGGTYSGKCREFKINECRVQEVGGWGFNWAGSSDGFLSLCSVQDAKGGGYNVAGGNSRLVNCKAYSTGKVGAPAPGFRISSSYCTLTGVEAQDCYGNGFEVLGSDCNLSGTADSTGVGAADWNNSAGFMVSAARCNLSGLSSMRAGGRGAIWIDPAAGMTHALRIAGASRLLARLVGGTQVTPWVGAINGTVSSDSNVLVL